MMRTAFWLLVAFAAAVGVALLLQANHGVTTVLWPPYRVEVSNNMAVVSLVVAFLVLYVLFRILARVLSAPSRLRERRERREHRRTIDTLQGAMVAYYEGRYDQAEKLATEVASTPATQGAASLIAARAAHRLGAPARRDEYLVVASELPESQAAALQTRADFALQEQRPELAIDAVGQMGAAGSAAQQRVALSTALNAYRQSERWDMVMDTARQLRKEANAPVAELDSVRVQAYRRMLAPREGDARAIREVWKSLSADERRETDLAAITVGALARAGAHDEASRIALAVLDDTYDAATVEAYGASRELPARVRLEQLERWRNTYGDRPKLLEMLGRICAQEGLWGKAETYLHTSIAAEDSVSSRVALGQLYEATQRTDDAAREYRAAARLALGEQQPSPVAQGRPHFGAGTPVLGAAGGVHASVLDEVEAAGVTGTPADWHEAQAPASGDAAAHDAPAGQGLPSQPSRAGVVADAPKPAAAGGAAASAAAAGHGSKPADPSAASPSENRPHES